MAHKLMEHKSQARDERILEGKKQKWENYQSGNSSGKSNYKDNYTKLYRITKSRVAHELWLPFLLMERCLLDHFLCLNVVLIAMLVHVQSSVTSVERLDIRQGTVRRRMLPWVQILCPFRLVMIMVSKVILGIDAQIRSFMDTRFSSMLNIDPVKIGASYELELADGKVVSTNTILRGFTFNLVNHIFKIDLMPIELGIFDFIIGMNWLVKHDAVFVCGEKFVHIPYENKTLIVESNKGVSRLKVISCIKASKGFLFEERPNEAIDVPIEDERVLRLSREDLLMMLSSSVSIVIIMVNVTPLDHVDDVLVVELNQHDDVLVVLEPVLVDEDEDLKKEEFEEEEDPQEEVDPLNPSLPASESEHEDVTKAENPIKHQDETVPVSVHEVGESSTIAIPRKHGNEVRSSVEQGTTAMEKLVEKLGNAEDKAEYKKLKKGLEEARGFVFEERPNEAIDVPIEDERILRLSREDLLMMLSSSVSIVVSLLCNH
nr:reverse transcriptase domain-containing protein [Tanacetum cinerariifolium]